MTLKDRAAAQGLKRRDSEQPVIVAGIQSVWRRAAEIDAVDLILLDEAHLVTPGGEGMYRTFRADARKVNPHLRLIGVTATPFRLSSGMSCARESPAIRARVHCRERKRQTAAGGIFSR